MGSEMCIRDSDDIKISIAGTFAADRFIVIANESKKPWVPAAPHPRFDYESKTFIESKGISAPENIG